MGADTETHSQTLGREKPNWRTPLDSSPQSSSSGNSGRVNYRVKTVGVKGVEDTRT